LDPTIIVSLIGITASLLFFLKKFNFYYLSIIWIIFQIPYIVLNEFTLDLSQHINFHISLNIGSVSLGLNFQILFLLFLKQIMLSEFLFQKITFKAYTENPKLNIENEYSFIPTEIKSKKLIGKTELLIENKIYSMVKFEPLKSERIKKAGITLIPIDNVPEIKATVKYKLNNNVW
jgi:hypothetical protein